MLGIKQEIERQGKYFYLAVVRYLILNMTLKFFIIVVVTFTQMELVSGYDKEKAKKEAHSLLFVAEIIARWRRKKSYWVTEFIQDNKTQF